MKAEAGDVESYENENVLLPTTTQNVSYLIYNPSASVATSSSLSSFCVRLLRKEKEEEVLMTRLDQHCQQREEEEGKAQMVLHIKGKEDDHVIIFTKCTDGGKLSVR